MLCCLFLAFVALAASQPSVPLRNAAVPGLMMPAIGLGTGGYGLVKGNAYPNGAECWVQDIPGCGQNAANATKTWLQMGGKRLDSADSYFNQLWIGRGIADSGVARSDIFITSKVGPSNPLGYQDTLDQAAGILSDLNTPYVDLLLIHWPTYAPSALSPAESKDPACNTKASTYNEKQCRLNTWKAMVELFQQGKTRSIGVSNYNQTHIQEIIDANMPLPAVNQCPFNPHRSKSQMNLVNFCQQHNITFNGYSPMGIPDLSTNKTGTLLYHRYPPPMMPTILEEPVVLSLATKYKATPGQILINFHWSFGIVTNPRSQNAAHMQDNLNAYKFSLTVDDQTALLSLPENYCKDDQWYECAPDPTN